jgi:hypothetical protein
MPWKCPACSTPIRRELTALDILANGVAVPDLSFPATARPATALTKDGHRVDAQLVDQTTAGCELRLLKDGEWLSGRRFSDKARSMAHGENIRHDLERTGWTEG